MIYGGRKTDGIQGQDPHQDIPGMGDTGIGQQAFKVFLNQGRQISEGHGNSGQEDQDLNHGRQHRSRPD